MQRTLYGLQSLRYLHSVPLQEKNLLVFVLGNSYIYHDCLLSPFLLLIRFFHASEPLHIPFPLPRRPLSSFLLRKLTQAIKALLGFCLLCKASEFSQFFFFSFSELPQHFVEMCIKAFIIASCIIIPSFMFTSY